MVELATVCRALSDPNRLAIYRLIRDRDLDLGELTAILAQRDRQSVAAAARALAPETAAEIRWLFTSFGTCSTKEPVADLASLGLLSQH